MKKKILSVLLTTAMVASMLVGCGSSQGAAESTSTSTDTQEAAPAEDASAEDTSSETTDAAAEKLVWQCLQKIFRDGIRMAPIWKLS